jgi:beta-glucosidase
MKKELTLAEKIESLSGVDGWKTANFEGALKSVFMSDGPNGVRQVYQEINTVQSAYKNNAYPTLSALANTRNKEMVYEIGNCIAEDCIKQNINIILGPGVNIKRNPLCGRNFEYFSEDPYLAGILASAYINGVQSRGVGACLKHFCANNSEYDRFYQSSEIDERTLHEIYLRPFEIAIKNSKPRTMMCSYNPVNGVYTSESNELINNELRCRLGFDGYMISDWGAVRDRAKSLKAGIDLAMPFDSKFADQLKTGLDDGFIKEKDIDLSINRLITLNQKIEINKDKYKITLSEEDKNKIAIKASEESIILLKNADNLLPLKNKEDSIAVIGYFAEHPTICGEGSAKVVPIREDLSLIDKLTKEEGFTRVFYESAYIIRYNLIQPCGYKNAIKLADECNNVILCVGNNDLIEKEETDRETINLKPQIVDLINKVSKVNSNTILVIYAGSVVNLNEIKDKVKTIVFAGYNGQGVNDALAKIISGKVNPSGKTSETFIADENNSYFKSNVGDSFVENYREKGLVGYRYYEKKNIDVVYPFGFGLSYSEFEYSNLRVKKISELNYEISYDIKNISNIDGKEISQIYVGNEFLMVEMPKKQLVNFSKDLIKAGETKTISLNIDEDAFRYYSLETHNWYVENGTYKLYVCSSSKDVRLEDKIVIKRDYCSQYSNK